MRGDEGAAVVLADPGIVETLLAAGAPDERLVPADVGGLRTVTGMLAAWSEVMETAGRALSRVEVTEWRGSASSAFAEDAAGEPRRWQSAAEAFSSAAAALDRYADDVLTARAVAAAAVEVYARYVLSVERMVADASGVGSGSMTVGMRVSLLQDVVAVAASSGDAGSGRRIAAAAGAADGLRLQALGLMARARALVDGAGDLAARSLETAASAAPEARRFWASTIRPADAVGAGHTVLDTVGLVPALGGLADGANALWYLGEGDTTDAGLSAVGLIPLVGEVVILEKYGRRILVRDGVLVGGRAAAGILAGHTLLRLTDGGLLAHELDDAGHTIARHVGRTDAQLAQRLADQPYLDKASSFITLAGAERYTYANLAVHQTEIKEFLDSGLASLEIRQTFDHAVGRTLWRDSSSITSSDTVVTRLRRDPTMPQGYRIITSFPDARP